MLEWRNLLLELLREMSFEVSKMFLNYKLFQLVKLTSIENTFEINQAWILFWP